MKDFAPRTPAAKTATPAPGKGAALVDNRATAVAQRHMQQTIDSSPRQVAQCQLAPAPRPNRTGLPDKLKAGVESLSGHSLDDVKVHYNSARPAQLQAHAYAQGTDIHLGPGQEKHLPHEAWHVVQQKQGRVRPTLQLKGGVNVNDDAGLEKEADVMGRIISTKTLTASRRLNARQKRHSNIVSSKVSQLARRKKRDKTDPHAHRARRTSARGATESQYGRRSKYGRRLYPVRVLPSNVAELGNKLDKKYLTASHTVSEKKNFIYLATQIGKVVYVGITDNVPARQAEHGDRFHLHQLNRYGLSRIQARAVEQFGINMYRNDPKSQNIAESISKKHDYYSEAMEFGGEFFEWSAKNYPLLFK